MKNTHGKKAFYSLVLSVMCATTFGQKITIDREVTMLALGDSYTIGQSVALSERWPHQLIDQLGLLGIEADYPDYIATSGWTTRRFIHEINFMLDREKDYNLVSILIEVNQVFVSENHVKVYPNPTSSILHIDSDLYFNRARVFNALGSLVFDQVLNTKPVELDLSHLDPGFYTMQLSTANSNSQDIQKNIIIQALE